MFTSPRPVPGEEVVFSLTDPLSNGEEITRLVEEGFIVRTRADSGGVEPDNNDTTRFEAALASGAHTIATDYPGPVDGVEYWIDIPEGNRVDATGDSLQLVHIVGYREPGNLCLIS